MQVVGKEVFRRVEKELYSYPGYILMLQEQRNDIIYATPRREQEGRSIGHVSDPTLARGMKLAGLVESETGRWVNLIEYALARMALDHERLTTIKYFSGNNYSDIQMAMKLHVSVRCYQMWRKELISWIIGLAQGRGLI